MPPLARLPGDDICFLHKWVNVMPDRFCMGTGWRGNVGMPVSAPGFTTTWAPRSALRKFFTVESLVRVLRLLMKEKALTSGKLWLFLGPQVPPPSSPPSPLRLFALQSLPWRCLVFTFASSGTGSSQGISHLPLCGLDWVPGPVAAILREKIQTANQERSRLQMGAMGVGLNTAIERTPGTASCSIGIERQPQWLKLSERKRQVSTTSSSSRQPRRQRQQQQQE